MIDATSLLSAVDTDAAKLIVVLTLVILLALILVGIVIDLHRSRVLPAERKLFRSEADKLAAERTVAYKARFACPHCEPIATTEQERMDA